MDSNSNLEPIWGFFLELFSSRGSADRSPAELLQSSDRPTRVFEGGPSGHPKAFVAQVFHLDFHCSSFTTSSTASRNNHGGAFCGFRVAPESTAVMDLSHFFQCAK